MRFQFRSVQSWSVGAKLTLVIFLLITLMFISFITLIDFNLSRQVEQQVAADLTARTNLIAEMIDSFDRDQKVQVSAFSKVFKSNFNGDFAVDEATTVDVNGTATASMTSNGTVLNMDFKASDLFTAQTGGVATIFVRQKNDFVRISTSLKKENGERAIGTSLDKNGAAYKSIMEGNSYVGNAVLFGRQYVTQYDPVKSTDGKVIGILFVGSDFTESAKRIKDQIRPLKIGDTGYFYAINSKEGSDYGLLMLHPDKEGQNVLASKDADGHEFIKEMLEKKEGITHYPWINKELGETAIRKKMVAYKANKNWNWLIAGDVYIDEFTRESKNFMHMISALAIVVLLTMGAALYYTMRRRLSHPLHEVSAAAMRLAGGDLTVSLNVTRVDEIGQLMQAINQIGQGLTTVVHQVRNNTALIAQSSREIASGNADLSARTESQASSLEETAASMHELTGTVKQNSESAENANNLVVATSKIAARGGAVVTQVMDTMGSIQTSSRKIVDIISVIDGIAFQTNILALNAAVEAARAGEQGRGFAVVASEVRNLAQRSASAAKEIKTLIDDSVEKVDAGHRLVVETGETMTEVVDAVDRVASIIAEISNASREQSTGLAQINQAVAQMDEMTQQNAALVEQAAAGAKDMEEQAQTLVQAVSVFKVMPALE
ncbi:methyl-accepting chemotaxis protein [Undibacterium sp. TJN19]|uniref:methyl-accepting chemotaxis protein n=1 Tax=Undibacterium sp. TJN19 TaxID=3413055 RepID=UPI003BF3A09E